MTQKKLLILVLALWLDHERLEFSVVDKDGKELEVHKVDYGSRVLVKSGGKVKRGDRLAEWDPYATPILTETGGKVRSAGFSGWSFCQGRN